MIQESRRNPDGILFLRIAGKDTHRVQSNSVSFPSRFLSQEKASRFLNIFGFRLTGQYGQRARCKPDGVGRRRPRLFGKTATGQQLRRLQLVGCAIRECPGAK